MLAFEGLNYDHGGATVRAATHEDVAVQPDFTGSVIVGVGGRRRLGLGPLQVVRHLRVGQDLGDGPVADGRHPLELVDEQPVGRRHDHGDLADLLQQHLELDAASRTVRFLQDGMRVDLGAIGKGYAIDQAVEILEENGVRSGLLHGGTSTTYAIGDGPLTTYDPATPITLGDGVYTISATTTGPFWPG